MTIKESFQAIYLKLKSAKIERPHLESSWLIEKFCNRTDVERIQDPDFKLTQKMINDLNAAVIRREVGEPLAYILNEKEFYGLNFYVDSHVLIPRPETEFLVDWAIQWISRSKSKFIRIADLGTGSGCLGLSILKKVPHAHLVAIDNSAEAILVARKNAERLALSDRVNFFNEDAEKWLNHYGLVGSKNHAQFDLIVANPPYIDVTDTNIDSHVKKFEPASALFSDDNGLHHIKTWLAASHSVLVPGGALGFEIGATQGQQVLALFSDQNKFVKQYIVQDYAENDRLVCGEK